MKMFARMFDWKSIAPAAALSLAIVVLASRAAECEYAAGNVVKESMRLPAGKVVAAQIKDSSELMGGLKSSGQPGDYILWNNSVGFIIAGIRPASGVNPLGAVVEDAGVIRNDDGTPRWHNVMGDTFLAFFKGSDPMLGGRLFAPVKSEVLKDGSDGEAIVRFYGRDAEFELRKVMFGMTSAALKLQIIVDYILKKDSNVLEIKVTARKKEKGTIGLGQVYLLGDGADPFIPGCGYDFECIDQKKADIYAATSDTVSYGWFVADREINFHSRIDKLVITKQGSLSIPEAGEGSFSMYLAVGDGDVNSVRKAITEFTGKSAGADIAGTVVDESGAPVTDARVFAVAPDGTVVSDALPDAGGKFSMTLPVGDYDLIAGSYERAESKPVRVSLKPGGGDSVKITAGAIAKLTFNITDDNGAAMPATISFVKKDVQNTRFDTRAFYDRRYGGSFYKSVFSKNGIGETTVRPGKYDVYVSRGLEYEYEKKEVAFAPNESGLLFAKLKRSVDTTGYLSADFHVHASPSFDSDDSLRDKMLSSAAAGLEVPVATDHDVVTDYAPAIRELGLQKELNSLVGEELTTTRIGHFNGYPLEYQQLKRNGGAIDWIGMSGPQVFDAFRNDKEEKTVIQLNHPRSQAMGYFNIIKYDSTTGIAKSPEDFSLNFDSIEVLNGGSYDELLMTMPDWFSFLDRGKRATGLGNSDSHNSFSIEIGYPRNYVKSSTDIPGDMVKSEFVDNVLNQSVTVCGGPFVEVSVGGAGMGQTASIKGGSVGVAIKVQAPSWMKVDEVRIKLGGKVVKKIDVTGGKSPVVFDSVAEISAPSSDSWLIVEAEGSASLFPVYPGKRSYSFTNPVYLDVDGNGKYDAQLK